jgi:uncharacterized phage-like protein YoqJ
MYYLTVKIGDNPAELYLGGYGAFDAFAFLCAKKYKSTHQNTRLVFVTPYITPEYQHNHLEYYKFQYDEIIYPEIENTPPRFAISKRNKWMVEKSDYVIAYIDHSWGGAYQTYKHAKRKEKEVFNLSDKEI